MDWNLILNTTQIITSITLVILVMLQQQDPGFYSQTTSIDRTKRGSEKLIYNATIVSGALFVAVSLANFLV